MPSKGVDYWGFTSDPGFSIQYKFPSDEGEHHKHFYDNSFTEMYHGNYQLSWDDIPPWPWDLYGRYTWTASLNDSEVASKYAKINPLTGNMDDGGGGLTVMLETPSIITDDYTVCYGFYDAGSGVGDSLTDQDQSYVYFTKNYSNWMKLLVAEVSGAGDKPFTTWALPGVHDAGMFDPTEFISLLSNADWFDLLPVLAIPITLSESEATRAIINLAFTQKDNIATMLEIGIRYFDFRPGYNADIGSADLYHQHNVIPGYPYASFLSDVAAFLAANPSEIVVVSANNQGFYTADAAAMTPTVEVIGDYLATALKGQTLTTGDVTDLASSYNTLIQENKRLIFLNQLGNTGDPTKYDSYTLDPTAYITTDVTTIIGALNQMNSAGQAAYDYTVLQVQGTAQATSGAAESAIFTLSDASSPLMSTKANFDNSTYPWLMANVANNFLTSQLIVYLNDFGDNALVNTAFRTTALRMQK
jgi:hypothetical protein